MNILDVSILNTYIIIMFDGSSILNVCSSYAQIKNKMLNV